MANINDKIKFFTENLSLKTALNRKGQLLELRKEIGNYLAKALDNKNNKLLFTSQELRGLTIKIEKIQKQANKKIDFQIIENRLYERLKKLKPEIEKEKNESKKDKIRKKAFSEETNYITQYMALARDMQMLLSCFNYYAVDVLLLERIAAQEKAKDDNILKEELEYIFYELMRDSNND